MDTQVGFKRVSVGAKVGRLAARLFLTTVATAFTGAVANFFYEILARPDSHVIGPPILRGALVGVLTGPYILLGLIVLGLPTGYLLKRLNCENPLAYAIIGAVSGIAFGVTIFQAFHAEFLSVVSLFGVGSALFWWWFRPKP